MSCSLQVISFKPVYLTCYAGGVKAETLVVLVNVLYFKDDWKDEPFVKDQNLVEPFKLGDGSTVDADFMEADEINVGYKDLTDVEIISIPFNSDNFYFVIVAPKEDSGILGKTY